MLKLVGKSKPPAPPEEEPDLPIEPEAEAPPEVEAPMLDAAPMSEGGKVAPDVARYFGPECRCASCVHFTDPGSCEVVAGPVEARGMCSLYTPDQSDDESMEAPVEKPMPEEPPAAAPPMPMKGM